MNTAHRPPARRASLLALGLLALAGTAAAQNGNVAVNATGAAAQPTALLDVSSVTQGIFLPRMGSLPAAAGLPDGLTVYRTAGNTGFYTVDNGAWVHLLPGNDAWDIFGNYLKNTADPNPDFIGTTDGRPMYFRTNNLHRMRLDGGTGYLGVGYPAATLAQERLDVNGALRIYYESPAGVETSNADAAGTIRYQPYGNVAGTGQYRRGSREKPATNPDNAFTINAVLGTGNTYPLQYAAHWGNVDGKPMVQGVATPTVVQPRTGGWRAFENPYTEGPVTNWSHFRDAECTPGDVANIPSPVAGGPPRMWSNNPAIPATEQPWVTPAYMAVGNLFYRRQYLYRASELNLELAQVLTPYSANEGLCPGEPVDQIAFQFSTGGNRVLAAVNRTVTVRNAPPGVDVLNGFDNTPVNPATLSCGVVGPTWPTTTAGWEIITLSPPFRWDGVSNVLVEVAIKSQSPAGGALPRPVFCTDAGFPATYAAQTGQATFGQLPDPSPAAWSCDNTANTVTRMPDHPVPVPPGYTEGSSHFRPVIRFYGTVAKATPGSGIISGNGRYITYPGALVLEDTTVSGIPWGRWRPGYPAGTNYSAYQGNGTISAQKGVFDNGSILNDHVFDRAFDGRVAPTDAERFGNQRQLDIKEMEAFTRTHRHLPTMQGRAAWNEQGGFSLGDLGNQLWTTTETQALYVADLHDKLNVIEMLTNERPLTAAEFRTARDELATLADRTDAEKARLIAYLRQRAPLTPPSP